MPIDLVQAPHAFEDQMYSLPEDAKIDPVDAALLENPSGGVSSVNTVAFLRRTEYSSGAIVRGDSRKRKSLAASAAQAEDVPIEDTFSFKPLAELRHPKNKHLKAVKAWKVLPDTQQLDLVAKSVRMIGSAALSQNRRVSLTTDQLRSSLFTQTSVDEDSWISLFAPETNPKTDPQTPQTLQKVQDYEYTTVQPKQAFDELVLSLNDDTAYYLPLSGRVNLKRRRVDKLKKEKLEEHELDQVHVERVPLSAEESITRDKKRSEFDPVSYE